jgi:hypothetical protein
MTEEYGRLMAMNVELTEEIELLQHALSRKGKMLSGGHPAKLYPIGATPSPFESSTPLYTHPASAEVERLQARVAELVAVAVSVRDDLLLRSEIDSDGTRCVNLSASKWSSFCDVIDEAAKAEGAGNAG